MHRTTTTALLLATATLVLAGCSSTDDSKPDKKPATASAAAEATPRLTPSLSQAETKSQCSDAIAEAAPGWEDWNFSPGGWADDPRTPQVCLGLVDKEIPSRGNREYMAALLDGLARADDPRARQ